MKRFKVIASGAVLGIYDSREEAEKMLEEARNSYLAWVHPKDCFFIKEED